MHSLVTAAVSASSVKDLPPGPVSSISSLLPWLCWTVTLAAGAGVVWESARLMYILRSGILGEFKGGPVRVVALAVIASAGAIISSLI